MNAAAEHSLVAVADSQLELESWQGNKGLVTTDRIHALPANGVRQERIRVYVAAENRLLREALAKMLAKDGGVEGLGSDNAEPFRSGLLLEAQVAVCC